VDVAGAALAGGGHHLVDVEVGLHAHRVVGLAHVQRPGVEVGVDRDGPPAQAAGGAGHAAGDLAAVGDEEGVHVTS
jgi:hypothetical protein